MTNDDTRREAVGKALEVFRKNDKVGLTSPETILDFLWDEASAHERTHGESAKRLRAVIGMCEDQIQSPQDNPRVWVRGILDLATGKSG